MNTKQLQYFVVTAEKGSITGAAKQLQVAQPAISLQLVNLEHELKVKLLNRDFRGVTLTDEGNQFKKHALTILSQIELAKAELNNNHKECSGSVVVGISQSVCNVLSVDLLNKLDRLYENIKLNFRVGPSYVVNDWLLEKKVDIAICYDDLVPLDTDMVTVPLIKEDLFLYISEKPQNPAYSELALYSSIPFEDLQYYDVFMPDKLDVLSTVLEEIAKDKGIKLKTKAAFGQAMTTLHFVTQGLGLIICPSALAFHLEQSHQIRAIKIIEPAPNRRVYLHKSDPSNKNAAIDAVFELIREITAKSHENGHWRGKMLDNKYTLEKKGDFI
jgi:LysR family nitrogen assimilation transcriptional regulator